MSEEHVVEVPPSLLKLEELRLDSIQYWARSRALEDRRQALRSKLDDVREYQRRLVEGKRGADLRAHDALARYEKTQADQLQKANAIQALLNMVEAEQERICVFAPTADLFRRAEEHYLSEVVGWQRDAV